MIAAEARRHPGAGDDFEPWDGDSGVGPAEMDALLVHAARQGASDIVLQTGAAIRAEKHGRSWAACRVQRRLGAAAITQVCVHLYGPSAEVQLAAGLDLNCAHAARAADGRTYRFRVNISAVFVRHAAGVNIVIRPLPNDLPDLAGQGLPEKLASALTAGAGLSVVTGVPGSGKSTLLAAVIRQLAETGLGRIQTYEAPIEFSYDGLPGSAALVSQSAVPGHFRDFASGVRASLRRSPAAILVGEARERATVEAVIDAADFGIAVYTTTHAMGVANTIRRFLAEFAPEEREARAVAMLEALNAIVTQALVRHPAGGRTAIREWLVFDAGMKARLLDQPHARWSVLIARHLSLRGQTLADAAASAVARGMAEPDCLRRFAASPGALTRQEVLVGAVETGPGRSETLLVLGRNS